MPDIYLDVDAALSEVPVNIMPLLDDTDFKSREITITYDQAGMDLVWNFVTSAGAMTQTAVTPTTGGDYDWAHQGDGMYSIEITASGGASINNDTEGYGWFTGICTGVLPWRGPVIGFRDSGINDLLMDSAYSATRGLAGTALPNVAAEAAGGLFTRGSGAGQINQDTNGQIDSDVQKWLGTTVATPTTGGVPEVDLTYLMGTILTESGAGRLKAAFVKLFDVATPALVASDVMRGTDSANTVVPDAAGVAPTAVENRQEMDSNSTELAKIGTIPALDGGGQTIGAAIGKLADDNAGATFNATNDSLNKIKSTQGTAQTADNNTILAHASYGNAQLVRSTTPANTLDVSATGESGLDFDNIKDATGAHTLTNITVPIVTTVGTTTTNTDMRGTDSAATAAKVLAYIRLLARSDAAVETDASAELTAINADEGAGAGNFSSQTDSGEAQRDRGDVAWIAATGFAVAGDAMTLSNGAITAAVIATDAIDADSIKADAVTLIQAGLATATNVTDAHSTTDTLIPTAADNPIKTDTYTLPGQGAPTATPTLEEAIMYLYKAFTNKTTQTATLWTLLAANGTTADQKSTVSDDGTTFTKGALVTGA